MGDLYFVAFIGGLISGASPCVVPVLPVILAGGATGQNRSRPFLIIAGLVISFSLAELLGSLFLSALGLPQNLLTWIGEGMLFVLAAALMLPRLEEFIEKPFARLGATRYATRGGGLVLGLSLGLVFIPCAGPVLGAISTAAANRHFTAELFIVTLLYAAGATIPLLILGVIAQRFTNSWSSLKTKLPTVRRVSGAVLAVATLAITLHWLEPLQTNVPGFTTNAENSVESGASITPSLNQLAGEHANQFVAKASKAATKNRAAKAGAPVTASSGLAKVNLPELGRAPDFTGIVNWLNTPGNTALSLAQLRGKVVLIDFWTYSCINCQRALPHVESWYNTYKQDGLVVVGVSTPEFAFEHVVSNVQSAAGHLGIHYPIAIDNNYGTWDAYNNEYWPADYLIDQTGHVRAYNFGEGGYGTTESAIRTLLAANRTIALPARTDVPNKTPNAPLTQETYIGYTEAESQPADQGVWAASFAHDQATTYRAPSTLPLNGAALDGMWTDHSEEATAGSRASLQLHFTANDVYLVLGGEGTVKVSFNGRPLSTVHVSGVPTLYTLFSGTVLQTGQLTMTFSPGVEAYDFTFG
jgi:cytochrome c biogenesis protein CcdA/thiol-disulfide isomerase/thioredoxin